MLTNLTINNVVLIDRLALTGEKGLCALTGETGAGKSILLDSLGLALGYRAESRLVRNGEEQASVTAVFDVDANHKVFNLLKESEVEVEGEPIILRRTLSKDGKSKAFINDMPVSVQLLKDVGSLLVEVHGQFDTQGLMNAETHIDLLDSFARISNEVENMQSLYKSWRDAEEKIAQAKADIETSKLQEEYLTHAVHELEKLDPQPGEEEELAAKRKKLMNMEKAMEAFDQASQILDDEQGLLNLFGKLQYIVDRTEIPDLMETAERAKVELGELSYQIEHYKSGSGNDGESLEVIEDRFFALKDCARKHRVTVDDLPKVYEELSEKLRLITHQEDAIAELEKALHKAKDEFIKFAKTISKKRATAAEKLANAVNAELPALKLDKAKFVVEVVSSTDEGSWNAKGMDKIKFLVSTNAQTPAGAINKIASGGELARFMLAIKVVLAEGESVETLVFDEVDSGIGGATAAAVGERLARLSAKYQVLVVTHSAQVAAKANNHWVISKADKSGKTVTSVKVLDGMNEREDEVARMISGATITKEARAAAAKLLEKDISHAA